MMAWSSILLNGFLSMIDMKQQLMTGTENGNCCGGGAAGVKASRSLGGISRPGPRYTNPVRAENSPDPGVTRLADGSGWVAVTTSDHADHQHNSTAFPLLFSRDLVHWEPRGFVFRRGSWPAWAQDSMWAPELHNVNGRYIVYYVARSASGHPACGAAVALTSDPFGPYLDTGRPLVTARDSLGGAIDPHYFKDPLSGRDFLLWKEDKPMALQASVIYTRELHPSGLRFQGPAVALLAASLSSLLEERLVAEAPWMMFMRGYYYLFYSSGWTTEVKYHIRVAVSRSPTGPFTRAPRPVITTDWNRFAQGHNCSWVGPGHGSVVEQGGDWWLLYHAWRWGEMNGGSGRMMLMDKIRWEGGWPVVGTPSDTPVPAPMVLHNVP